MARGAVRGPRAVLQSGDWLVLKRVKRRGIGEIKVSLQQVDAVRKGHWHVGSTPTTSTISLPSGGNLKVPAVADATVGFFCDRGSGRRNTSEHHRRSVFCIVHDTSPPRVPRHRGRRQRHGLCRGRRSAIGETTRSDFPCFHDSPAGSHSVREAAANSGSPPAHFADARVAAQRRRAQI